MWFVYVDYTSDGRPFYVGKGDIGRVRRKERNSLHQNIARKHGHRREIEFASSIESLVLAIETELINEYKTHHGIPGHWGANLTSGGDGLSNPSPDVRRRMSEAQLRRPKVSQETRSRMSDAARRWNAVPKNLEHKRHVMRNVIRSSEHRQNIAHSKRKSVLQLDQHGVVLTEFQSGLDAQKATGISRTKICECCKGKRNSAGGYGWRYKETT